VLDANLGETTRLVGALKSASKVPFALSAQPAKFSSAKRERRGDGAKPHPWDIRRDTACCSRGRPSHRSGKRTPRRNLPLREEFSDDDRAASVSRLFRCGWKKIPDKQSAQLITGFFANLSARQPNSPLKLSFWPVVVF
jgi:hypothetical protein